MQHAETRYPKRGQKDKTSCALVGNFRMVYLHVSVCGDSGPAKSDVLGEEKDLPPKHVCTAAIAILSYALLRHEYGENPVVVVVIPRQSSLACGVCALRWLRRAVFCAACAH